MNLNVSSQCSARPHEGGAADDQVGETCTAFRVLSCNSPERKIRAVEVMLMKIGQEKGSVRQEITTDCISGCSGLPF